MKMSKFDLSVLENLPFRDCGASLAELADELCGGNDLSGRNRVRNALEKIGNLFDLISTRGRDDLTRWQVNLYCLASGERARVVAAWNSYEDKEGGE